MKILVYEPCGFGHYPRYLQLLLQALKTLESPLQITWVTRKSVLKCEAFAEYLADLAADIDVYPEAADELPHVGADAASHALAEDLLDSIQRHRPDHVFAPSSASAMRAAPMGCREASQRIAHDVEIECVFFDGLGNSWARHPLRTLRDRIWLDRILQSRCTRLLFVPFVTYAQALKRVGRDQTHRISYLPDVVLEGAAPLSRSEARRVLGIPEAGTYVGLVGCLDPRKNLGALLAGFFHKPRPTSCRLFLGGPLDYRYESLRKSYRDAVSRGQLILRTGYLSEEEFRAGMAALDVVSLIYDADNWMSSGLLLQAAASGKRLLTRSGGWIGYATDRFGLGSSVRNCSAVAISEGLDRVMEDVGRGVSTSATGQAWLDLSTPAHFKDVLTKRLRERLGEPIRELPAGWEKILWDAAPIRGAGRS